MLTNNTESLNVFSQVFSRNIIILLCYHSYIDKIFIILRSLNREWPEISDRNGYVTFFAIRSL